MFITSLQYIMFICLCYPVPRMLSKEDTMTSQILAMEKTEKFEQKTLNKNETNLKLEDAGINTPVQTQCSYPKEYISMEFCFIFLYHMTTRRISPGGILATSVLFFWKASAFPVNCTKSTDLAQKAGLQVTDRTRETGLQESDRKIETGLQDNGNHSRKSRSVSTTTFSQGDCEENWFELDDKCYKTYIKEIMNHKSASEYCASLESQLVTIQTKSENSYVNGLIANKADVFRYLWIGVQKLCMNCTETVGGYDNWSPEQPSGVSKCVTMDSRSTSGEWKEFDCGYMFAFVCEKALSETYTKSQLLIALLVPIFSCLTIAIFFTTALLVSSVRRLGQPLKVASRYARTKRERKRTTWDMVDIVRRASMTRRGSRFNKTPRSSAPSIEITRAQDTNGVQNGTRKPWYKRGNPNKAKTLEVPEESRRSSNSSGNSSLYELLVRLNKMVEIDPETSTVDEGTQLGKQQDEQRLATDEGAQLKELPELDGHTNGVKLVHNGTENGLLGIIGLEDHKQLVERRPRFDDEKVNGNRNMAFRDSVVSVETNGSGVARVTSVQQVNPRDSLGIIEDTNMSDAEHSEECESSRDKLSRAEREETGPGKKTQTVRADVHNVANYVDVSNYASSVANYVDNPEYNARNPERKPPSKGKVIWTYSL